MQSLMGSFRRDEGGAVMVEMTLITPFVLLLAAGVFEFSNILHTRMLLDAGVEDAARYVARCSDTLANCETWGSNLAVTGNIAGTGDSRVSGWNAADVQYVVASTPVTVDPATGFTNYRSPTPNVVVISATTTFNYSGTGLWSYLGFGTLPLTVSHEERVFGW